MFFYRAKSLGFFSLLVMMSAILFQVSVFAAKSDVKRVNKSAAIWQKVSESRIAGRGNRAITPEKYSVLGLNQTELNRVLNTAPLEFTSEARAKYVVLTVPKPDGEMMRFRIEESPILSPEVAAQFPNWKTFQGYGIDDPSAVARFDWTDSGFHGYVMGSNGTFAIDPYQTNDTSNYQVFFKNDLGIERDSFHCKLDEVVSEDKLHSEGYPYYYNDSVSEFTHGTQIRTYRLAIATTSQYTAYFRQAGDTDAGAQTRAFNQVTTSVNRINTVYRRELATSFTLVSGTNLTYVVEPETPANYANNGSSADLNVNQTNVDAVIGTANYDVAHVFQTADGGIAQLGSVCGSSKARGLSGLPNPVGDPFDVDYVAHELGHQFNANHTFNAASNCGSSPAAARVEPGSAVSIMGYAGICSSTSNVQRNSIDQFHVYNLTEAINFVQTGAGSTCGTLAGTNVAPVITPLTNFTIPYNTPFVLTANAIDADSDPITYSWEQNDAGASGATYPGTTDDDDIGLVARPSFRPYSPIAGNSRTYPSLPYILNFANEAPITYTGTSATGSICAATCITGEDLPSAARTMNFRVSVRDGRGGISDAGMQLNVINTGAAFAVSAPNTNETWFAGQSKTISWVVGGTNANGINTANVKISLSTDGGQTFPTVLFASTPNDGSEAITVPAIDTVQARIKVEAVGNVFFDISNANFTINSAPATSGVIGGRITYADGSAAAKVSVILTGGTLTGPVYTQTNSFGYYQFGAVPFNQTYTITPANKKFSVTPTNIVRSHTADATGLNFSATNN